MLQVVTTTTVFADFARAVGADRVSVHSLVPAGVDPHTFEPRPSDAVALATADIVLDNGLGLTPWFPALQANVHGDLVTLTALLTDAALTSGEVVDPHLWMVPTHVRQGYVPVIAEAFARRDPDGAADYAANAARYQYELAALEDRLLDQLQRIPEQHRVIATVHDGYHHFARHFGFGEPITLVGITTEEQPSARRMASTIEHVRAAGLPAVFRESTVNNSLIEQVARETGVVLGGPLYGDSVGSAGSGAGTYADMMQANVTALVDALAGAP